jgi:hypothetical protein
MTSLVDLLTGRWPPERIVILPVAEVADTPRAVQAGGPGPVGVDEVLGGAGAVREGFGNVPFGLAANGLCKPVPSGPWA